MTHAPTNPPSPQPQGDASPPARRLLRWLIGLSASGLVISLLVHLAAGIIAALVSVSYTAADAGGQTGTEIPFAVMTDAELFEMDPAPFEIAAEALGEASALQTEPTEPLADLAGLDADLLTDELADIPLDANTGVGASGPPIDASSISGGLSGAGAGASFFGLEAQGKRFCYIVDISSSMLQPAFDERTRMAVTKAELARSVTGLLESSEFVVILYAGQAGTLTGSRAWTDATSDNKLVARQRIGTVAPSTGEKFGIKTDGTIPVNAFRIAFKLRPRPDAIYFMTDGEFPESTADEVKTLNNSRRIPVHCILFNDPGGLIGNRIEPVMKRIARESGGRYRAVGSGGGP